ncbi:Signal transduction histidine kinase [Hymenobacter daecheongensis DSM 21074]|uniref:histidine kinase n=1 Tax=Hymenobacter daecheongensis DSM 21074 TaxID=1121955 RepID=A0A1M6A5K6_9BACT|nr:tetratricopeptide repeat-containing sensor histidine kinase [Hymenobacter daecheongensis]SHI31740.1 Signal transduction histidine kinase [Hymenobacter daecheongensis DSM 21074]
MRHLFFALFLILQLLAPPLRAQDTTLLHRQRLLLRTLPPATRRVRVLDSLCYALHETNIPQALAYGEQGVALARRLGDQPGLMRCLLSLGSCYASSSDSPHALTLYNEAHELARRLSSAEGLVSSYTYIAGIHHERGDTTIASRNYRAALRRVHQPGVSEHTRLILFGNAASFYFYQKRHALALSYMHKALYLARRNHDRSGEALYLANLGTYYWQKGRLEVGEGLVRRALQITQELHENRYEAGNLELLSLILLQQRRTAEAAEYAAQALQQARRSRYLERVLDAYSVLAQVNTQQQNYKQAYEWQERYLALNDTLNSRQRLNTLMALQTRYDLRDKEHQIRLLTERSQLQQLRNRGLWAVVGFLVVLIASGGLLYWQLRRNRAALRANNQALQETTTELRRVAASKDRLYAIVAHDLRGPVTSFVGVTELIGFYLSRRDEDGLRRLPELVRQSAHSLNGLLDNLLNWAVSQTGELAFRPEKLSVAELFAENAQLHQTTAEAKQISFETTHAPDLRLWADHNMTRTILRNLVGNALKFTPPGGHIRFHAAANPETGTVTLTVSDSGHGMPAALVEEVLYSPEMPQMLGSAHGARAGTGLGLLLCRAFVQRQGGLLSIHSTVGAGTTVHVQLPGARA